MCIRDSVKTAGRVTVGNLVVEKLLTTAGSDTWLQDWLYSCQDMIASQKRVCFSEVTNNCLRPIYNPIKNKPAVCQKRPAPKGHYKLAF